MVLLAVLLDLDQAKNGRVVERDKLPLKKPVELPVF
jgi:hypothetical protein